MAKRAAFIPAWTQSLDALIAENQPIRVACTECREWREVDLVALRERVGGSYSLLNRRCPCRLTPGCNGWNAFLYQQGVFRPLRDEETAARWMFGPRYSR